MQQHVERIYDLVFISLFNTILDALRAREWEEKERKQGERDYERMQGERERESFTSTLVFMKQSSDSRSLKEIQSGENIKTEILFPCLVHLLSVILLL